MSFDRNRPLQKQLYTQVVDWICEGRLLPGAKIPASRRLSEDLGLSRNTVLEVLDQLRAEGFVTSFPGKGVFISEALPVMNNAKSPGTWNHFSGLPVLSSYGESLQDSSVLAHGKTLPFTPGVPDLSEFPLSIWRKLQKRHSDRSSLMAYGEYQGYGPLREALAEYLCFSRGVECSSEQVIMTQGSQQAISICAQLLLNEGDSVLFENPGYLGARKAFLARQANLVPIPISENGVDVDYLLQNTKRVCGARLMYITPTHQYPMGGIMPAAQRLKLLDWAALTNTWLIEDDYDSEFHYSQKPIACLQGMAEKTPVIYMGSFSKTLFPALRLGYLVVPKELVPKFTQAKIFMGGEAPLLTQAIIADFIQEGHFVRHLRKMRQLYKQKWLHLDGLIESQLSGLMQPLAASAGMHLVLESECRDDKKLKSLLLKKGYGSSALSTYYLSEADRKGLVLGFSNTTFKQREDCVEYLREVASSACFKVNGGR